MRHTILALALLSLIVGAAQVAHADDLPIPAAQFAPSGDEAPRLQRREAGLSPLVDSTLERMQSAVRPVNVEATYAGLSESARSTTAAAQTYEVSPSFRDSGAQILCATVTAPKRRWSGAVAAYLWATSIKGTSFTDGEAVDLDADFSDLFGKLEYAFMGYAEVRYDKWSFGIDASTLKLADARRGPVAGLLGLDASLTQTIIDLRLGYTVLSCNKGGAKWGSCCYPRSSVLDVVLGARHWDLETDVEVAPPVGGVVTLSGSESWWDVYAGARWRWQWAKRWGLTLYGDVGGFGISDSSELTWQLQALVRYHVTRGFFLTAGYRALDVDRVEGSGATRNGVDANYHGPVLGLGYIF